MSLSRNPFQPFASPPVSPSMHLPTPQSPADIAHYLQHSVATLDSLSPSNPTLPSTSGQCTAAQRTAAWLQVNGQTATPESSPHRPRLMDPSMSLSGQHSRAASPILALELSDTHRLQPSALSSYESPVPDPVGISRLSSPFVDRSPTSSHNDQPSTFGHPHSPLLGASVPIHNPILLLNSSCSTPPPLLPSLHASRQGGVTLDKLNELSSHLKAIEERRPEYLKRTKRSLMEADPTALAQDNHQTSGLVGIIQSPATGRRLKLFQETSEESFEESLMAGGYGRYKTSDWVRQPQPLSIPLSTLNGGSVVALLEQAQAAPLSERDARKRRRLEAFFCHGASDTKRRHTHLQTVHLEGKGRVLIEAPKDVSSPQPRSPPRKKRTTRRRKAAFDKENHSSRLVEESSPRPNWPDSEFPWRLRLEQQAGLVKAEGVEKMRCIERFLDEDSDDEDVPSSAMLVDDTSDDEASHTASKRVPGIFRGHSGFTLGDPADARTALLAATGSRLALVTEADEQLCLCKGRDDGRELVQCDTCETWYHLACVGIKSIAELGQEEDPWYCSGCIPRRSSSPDLMETSKEPILVPTAEDIQPKQVYDPPFYQPGLQDSPMTWYSSRLPKTPTRANKAGPVNNDAGFSSASDSSWVSSSKRAPSTPSHIAQDGQSHHDYHRSEPIYEESPFDPTSTPSRGIKFGVPLITPKDGWWNRRNGSLFPHLATPLDASRHTDAGHHLARGDSPTCRRTEPRGASPLPAVSIRSSFALPNGMDESPIMRSRVVEKLRYDN